MDLSSESSCVIRERLPDLRREERASLIRIVLHSEEESVEVSSVLPVAEQEARSFPSTPLSSPNLISGITFPMKRIRAEMEGAAR